MSVTPSGAFFFDKLVKCFINWFSGEIPKYEKNPTTNWFPELVKLKISFIGRWIKVKTRVEKSQQHIFSPKTTERVKNRPVSYYAYYSPICASGYDRHTITTTRNRLSLCARCRRRARHFFSFIYSFVHLWMICVSVINSRPAHSGWICDNFSINANLCEFV